MSVKALSVWQMSAAFHEYTEVSCFGGWLAAMSIQFACSTDGMDVEIIEMATQQQAFRRRTVKYSRIAIV